METMENPNRKITPCTDLKFLNIFKVEDPENNVKAYYFAQRLGIDSIAFICYDPKIKKFLLNMEYTPPTNEFHARAFGGSLDKSNNPLEIVIAELEEEAGFIVDKKDIIPCGRIFVSTQMNQYCHIFLVKVDAEKQQERKPENAIEAMSQTTWLTLQQIIDNNDWKSITIVSKIFLNKTPKHNL